jgi:hypothetical protein
LAAVRAAFEHEVSEGSRIFLQVKDENWGGEFTDIAENECIADKRASG